MKRKRANLQDFDDQGSNLFEVSPSFHRPILSALGGCILNSPLLLSRCAGSSTVAEVESAVGAASSVSSMKPEGTMQGNEVAI